MVPAALTAPGRRRRGVNPPLLVTSDIARIEIRTNFTGLSPVLNVVTLDDLAADGVQV